MATASPPHLHLSLAPARMSVCQLAPAAAVPAWASGGTGFISVTRTREELSIVCPEALVPAGLKQESGWRILQVEGPLDFALTGILAALLAPLARAGVSIFALSTFNTDYVLVQEPKLPVALAALRAAGHTVRMD